MSAASFTIAVLVQLGGGAMGDFKNYATERYGLAECNVRQRLATRQRPDPSGAPPTKHRELGSACTPPHGKSTPKVPLLAIELQNRARIIKTDTTRIS